MPRLYSIPLKNAIRAEQLHRLAFEDFRSVQQQAAYLLDQAIEQAAKTRGLVRECEMDEDGEVLYAQTD
jgi:hypothetical protein